MIAGILANVITLFFFLVVLSYYALIFIRPSQKEVQNPFLPLTVIIPAYNEERFIRECIKSAKQAEYKGKKDIIIVNDGSTDRTEEEIRSELDSDAKLISIGHIGKANAINTALKQAKGELIMIIDADTVIGRNAFVSLSNTLADEKYGAATGIIKVKNNKRLLGMWLHIEQIYNSLMRSIFAKINANIVTPGPLSMYRRKALEEINGFSSRGFSEDVDVAIRLVRKGYKIGFNENAVAMTNMPYTFKGFFRQRSRFAKGWLNIFRKHLQLNNSVVDIYSLPLALFTYVQGVVMGIIILNSVIAGYFAYFYSKGIFFGWNVMRYFLDWFSIAGTIRWVIDIAKGVSPLTFMTAVSLIIFFMTYPLYIMAILKYDKKISWRHVVPLCFMFPFWFAIMIIYILNLPECFKKSQINIWEKVN